MIPPFPPGMPDATRIHISRLYARFNEIGVRSEWMKEKADKMWAEVDEMSKEAKAIEKELRFLLKIKEEKRSRWWPWFLPIIALWVGFYIYSLLV